MFIRVTWNEGYISLFGYKRMRNRHRLDFTVGKFTGEVIDICTFTTDKVDYVFREMCNNRIQSEQSKLSMIV